jgi:cyclopropane fatty-acyl-phospholipid synthase-like methyltransferase
MGGAQIMNILVYELIYRIARLFNVPISWVFGNHQELQKVLLSVAGPPGTALDLGCGNGRDAIFLARHGFDVTAVDFSPTAIRMARQNVQQAGVLVTVVQDDLTKLRHVTGTFDLVVDIGAFSDLSREARDLYMDNVLPLTRTGSRFFLMCFEKKLAPGEIDLRFGPHFEVERLEGDVGRPAFPGIHLYSMVRT